MSNSPIQDYGGSSASLRSSHLPRWRSHAKDFSRRPTLVKQLSFFAVVLVLAVPIWLITYNGTSISTSRQVVEDPLPNGVISSHIPLDVHHVIPHHGHNLPLAGHHAHKHPSNIPAPHEAPDLSSNDIASSSPSSAINTVTFAFIVWEEPSAAEGSLLIKSILMYASGPIHIHIICDQSARQYIESRLQHLKHPVHDVFVSFYQLTWQSIIDRLNREGSIWSAHSAGAVGLLKLLVHEILPETVKKAIYVDTDALFISNPLLLWQQFDKLKSETAIAMPSHPNLGNIGWHNADRICSCVILFDLEKLRKLRLIDSTIYRAADDGKEALSPPAFRAMFGEVDPNTGHFEDIALGDQSYWWSIISYRPELYEHLSYDWEISSCIVDTYDIGLGDDMSSEENEVKVQLAHTTGTPHENKLVIPKILHFNCIPTEQYFKWPGWDDPEEPLNNRWGPALRYHQHYKWLWLNQATEDSSAKLVIEKVEPVVFADQLYEQRPH